jgi:Mg-chelatase subunit ChlD
VDAGREAAAAAGKKDEARAAYIKAIDASAAMQPERRAEYVKFIQEALSKL